MVEVPACYLIDEKKWKRKYAAWTIGILAFIVGIPSALSGGASEVLTRIEMPFLATRLKQVSWILWMQSLVNC